MPIITKLHVLLAERIIVGILMYYCVGQQMHKPLQEAQCCTYCYPPWTPKDDKSDTSDNDTSGTSRDSDDAGDEAGGKGQPIRHRGNADTQ